MEVSMEFRKRQMELRKSQMSLILELMQGNTINEIAVNLNSTYSSIQKRTQNLYKKFNVKNRQSLCTVLLQEHIISSKQVSNKFRNRFKTKIVDKPIPEKIEKLTPQELEYLSLVSKATTKKDIIKIMNLRNMHYCNYIQACICEKLNAVNMVNALFIAGKLNLV